jgi:CRP-like cAMP-binding protein
LGYAYRCTNYSDNFAEWNGARDRDGQLFWKPDYWRRYDPGETLFLQGDENRGVFYIQSGLVALRRSDAHGNFALVRLGQPGDELGYPAFLAQKCHPNTAEVLTQSKIGFIGASRLRWMLERDPCLKQSFLERALIDLSKTEANCAALLTTGLRCRLFHLLLTFFEIYGAHLSEGTYRLDLPVQRKDLAALLGAQPESLSRLIKTLDQEGLVRFEGRQVAFSDVNRLMSEAPAFN